MESRAGEGRDRAPATAGGGLRRTLSGRDVVVLTLSVLSPAASVYITGSGILHLAGTAAAIALPVGGAVIVVASLLYAELASAFPRAGGVYPGISRVLGAGAGASALALAVVTSPAFLAFIALGFADYMRVLAPGLPRLPLAEGALGAAILLSVLNVRANAWIVGGFLAVELLTVLLLTGVAGAHAGPSLVRTLLHPQMLGGHGRLVPTPVSNVMLAAVAGAFACSGSGAAIYFAEELRGAPSRVGRLIVWVGVIASVVVATPLVLMSLSSTDLTAAFASQAPIAQFLKETAGPAAAYAAALAVGLAILNNIIASTLAFSRFLYATGRDGLWPAPVNAGLSRLDPRFGSPLRAAALLGIAAGALCLIGERPLLVLLSGEVFTATLVVFSVLVGRRRGLTGVGTFRAPLYPFLPILGLGIVAAFLVADWRDPGAGRPSLLLLAGIATAAFLAHALRLRWRPRPTPPLAAAGASGDRRPGSAVEASGQRRVASPVQRSASRRYDRRA